MASYEAHISRVSAAGSLSYVGPIQLNLVSPRRYRADLGDGVSLHYVYKKWVNSREYGGHLYHPDFIHRLLELQSEDPEAEEELLAKSGRLILGVPLSHYMPKPPQAPWSISEGLQ